MEVSTANFHRRQGMQVAKPLIFTVDDDLVVLNAIERDLRKKYGRDYRIVKADSGAAALNAAGELRKRGEIVAAFVADQRMPPMTGVQFLEAARARSPSPPPHPPSPPPHTH